MLSAAEGSCRHSMKLPGDPSAALSMTDFPLNHSWDFEYTLLGSGFFGLEIEYSISCYTMRHTPKTAFRSWRVRSNKSRRTASDSGRNSILRRAIVARTV